MHTYLEIAQSGRDMSGLTEVENTYSCDGLCTSDVWVLKHPRIPYAPDNKVCADGFLFLKSRAILDTSINFKANSFT